MGITTVVSANSLVYEPGYVVHVNEVSDSKDASEAGDAVGASKAGDVAGDIIGTNELGYAIGAIEHADTYEMNENINNESDKEYFTDDEEFCIDNHIFGSEKQQGQDQSGNV